jgi:hypothetical protein
VGDIVTFPPCSLTFVVAQVVKAYHPEPYAILVARNPHGTVTRLAVVTSLLAPTGRFAFAIGDRISVAGELGTFLSRLEDGDVARVLFTQPFRIEKHPMTELVIANTNGVNHGTENSLVA